MKVEYWLFTNADEISDAERIGMLLPDREFKYFEGVLNVTELAGAYHDQDEGRIVILFKGGSETWAIKFSQDVWDRIQSNFG